MNLILIFAITCTLYEFTSSSELDDVLKRVQDLERNQRKYEKMFHEQRSIIESQKMVISRLENMQQFKCNASQTIQETNMNKGTNLVNETSRRIKDQQPHYRQVVIQDHPKIAFSAYLGHSMALGSYQTIMFDKVLTNDGSAYNAHTGVFTCPFAGMYLFSFQISSRNTDQVWAHLVVNDNFKVDGVADGYHTNQDAQGGSTVALHLKVGDRVWIKAFHGGNFNIEYHSGHFNVFTGVLLYT